MKSNAELIVFCGPMFSAKTSAMLMTLERFKYQGRHIFAFKPGIDNRYSQSEIVTHMDWRIPAVTISEGSELIRSLMDKTPDQEDPGNVVVAVDEMFMIKGVAEQLIWLFKSGVTVVTSTLDLSSSCQPFEEVTKVLPWATRVEKLTSVCSVCQGDAAYTWRKQDSEDSASLDTLILVGGSETYEPRCKKHHPGMSL